MSLLLGNRLVSSNISGKISKITPCLTTSVRFKYDMKKNMTQNEKDWVKVNNVVLLEKAKSEKGIDLTIDQLRPQLYFDKSKELENADETIKKIFSLEYASRADYKRYEEEQIIKEFQRNILDEDSLDIQIAKITMNIRRMCNNLEEFKNRNKRVRFFLFRQIHRRDRLLAELFHKDNQRYELLKKKLKLEDYQLTETYPYIRETKYEKFLKEVKEKSDADRANKMDKLRLAFEQEKIQFFKDKERLMQDIEREVKELGLEDLSLFKKRSAV